MKKMDDSVRVSDRPSHRRPSPSAQPTPELFASIAPPPRRRGLWWLVNASLVVHVAIGATLVLVPLYFSGNMPLDVDPLRLIIYNPPPPPPPPLARSSARIEARPSRTVVPVQQATLTAPREDPHPTERRASLDDEGLDTGLPEGMEGGVEGGVVGGVPGGVLGGVIGGTGDGPVLDWDQGPRLLRQTKPHYPKDAFVKKIEGTVELDIVIDASGRVADARVVRSIPLLDAAAIECVKEWLFAPATKNGRPVATLAKTPIRFSLL